MFLCPYTPYPGAAFWQGLQASGVPFQHLGHPSALGWAARLRDVALGVSDTVWTAREDWVQGLERRVVVLLDRRLSDSVRGPSGAAVGWLSRVRAISRATTQAVLVLRGAALPPPPPADDGNDDDSDNGGK